MKPLFQSLLCAWLLCSAVLAAPQSGERAPLFALPQLNGQATVSLQSMGGRPLAIWFPDTAAGSLQALPGLKQLTEELDAGLLIIPVVGNNADAATPFTAAAGTTPVLLDSSGQVTLSYTGEFIVGVAPRQNLFLVDSGGSVRAVRYYPGVPLRVLTGIVEGLR